MSDLIKLLGLLTKAGTFLLRASLANTAARAGNVILFIGDGMGSGHVKAGRAFVK